MARLVISSNHAPSIKRRWTSGTWVYSSRLSTFRHSNRRRARLSNYRRSIDASASLKIRTAAGRGEMGSLPFPLLLLFSFLAFLPRPSTSLPVGNKPFIHGQCGDKSASGTPRASIFLSLRNVPSPRERDRTLVGQFLLPGISCRGCSCTRVEGFVVAPFLSRDSTFYDETSFRRIYRRRFPCFNMCQSFPRYIHNPPTTDRLFLPRWIACLAIYLPPFLPFFSKNKEKISPLCA